VPRKDPAARRAYNAEYNRRNAERLRAYRRAHWLDPAVRERSLARGATWQRANVERQREANRRSYAKHLDARRVRARERRLADLARYRAAETIRRARRREWQREYERAWRRNNREAARVASIRKRSLRRGAPGSFTRDQWIEKVELLGGVCFYCGRSDRPLTVDHKTPICRGGSNSIENIVPACATCNFRKGRRTAKEFLEVPRAA